MVTLVELLHLTVISPWWWWWWCGRIGLSQPGIGINIINLPRLTWGGARCRLVQWLNLIETPFRGVFSLLSHHSSVPVKFLGTKMSTIRCRKSSRQNHLFQKKLILSVRPSASSVGPSIPNEFGFGLKTLVKTWEASRVSLLQYFISTRRRWCWWWGVCEFRQGQLGQQTLADFSVHLQLPNFFFNRDTKRGVTWSTFGRTRRAVHHHVGGVHTLRIQEKFCKCCCRRKLTQLYGGGGLVRRPLVRENRRVAHYRFVEAGNKFYSQFIPGRRGSSLEAGVSKQCDQMVRLFFNILAIWNDKISQKM